MTAVAVGGSHEGLVALAAAVAAAAALVVPDRRRRAAAMLAGAALAALALVLLVGANPISALRARPVVVAAAVVGAAAIGGLAVLLRARPALLPALAVAAVPFRVPVPAGDGTASLLVPLYAVIAAGCLAFAADALRPAARPPSAGAPAEGAPARTLRLALAAILVLYGLQSLYSTDVDQAVESIVFFHVPFALLFLLLLDVAWTSQILRRTFGVAVALAIVCAVVGIGEFATGRLLIANEKVLEANELKPYFRVNSLFFDPNIYGRFLALAMIVLAAVLLWSRGRGRAMLLSAALATLWGGLVLSLSQSSFAALLAGLAVLAAVRWRAAPVVAAGTVAALATVAIILAAPAAVGLETGSERELDRATSGRVDLVQGALRMIGDRPVTGFGSGSFAERYRARERVRSQQAAAISHTTPLTITAEQGVVGLAAYLALLAAALATLFGNLLPTLRNRSPDVRSLARLAVGAAFVALVLHTYAYAAFLEDPLAWLLLAVGAGLGAAATPPRARPRPS
jgi:putative inorganic carbon (HCO3(-)) transporter